MPRCHGAGPTSPACLRYLLGNAAAGRLRQALDIVTRRIIAKIVLTDRPSLHIRPVDRAPQAVTLGSCGWLRCSSRAIHSWRNASSARWHASLSGPAPAGGSRVGDSGVRECRQPSTSRPQAASVLTLAGPPPSPRWRLTPLGLGLERGCRPHHAALDGGGAGAAHHAARQLAHHRLDAQQLALAQAGKHGGRGLGRGGMVGRWVSGSVETGETSAP